MIIRKLLTGAVLLCLANVVYAEDCQQHFLGGTEPLLINQKLTNRGHEICYEAYALFTSGMSRTAIWSAEHLTRDNLELAAQIKRINPFHAEESVPAEDRAELSDYKSSGYDRGHMAPNGDMPTKTAQHESFSLANMIPQWPSQNQGIWSEVESAVREYTKEQGELFVVTGPAFIYSQNDASYISNGRVLVPSHTWKAIYNPKTGESGAYFVVNNETSDYETLSMAELQKRVGIDVFPKLPSQYKVTAMTLPTPTKGRGYTSGYHHPSYGAAHFAGKMLYHSFKHAR